MAALALAVISLMFIASSTVLPTALGSRFAFDESAAWIPGTHLAVALVAIVLGATAVRATMNGSREWAGDLARAALLVAAVSLVVNLFTLVAAIAGADHTPGVTGEVDVGDVPGPGPDEFPFPTDGPFPFPTIGP